MTTFDYKIQWQGPYRCCGTQRDTLFAQQEAKKPGIYLWTVPYEGRYLTYYVGETGRPFIERLSEHLECYLRGFYRIYDPQLFTQGKKTLVWEGMWKPDTRDRMGEFLNRYIELSSQIHELLGLFSIFIAPFDADTRTRKRVEARIAQELNQQPGVVGTFQDDDIKYNPKRDNEAPLRIF